MKFSFSVRSSYLFLCLSTSIITVDDGKSIFESDVIRIYILKNETLTLIVFVSRRAFQQSSCVFYLIIMTIVDTIHLFTMVYSLIS